MKEIFELDENGNPTGRYNWDYGIKMLEDVAECNIFDIWESEKDDDLNAILMAMPDHMGLVLSNMDKTSELYDCLVARQEADLNCPKEIRENPKIMYELFEMADEEDISSCFDLMSDELKKDKEFLEKISNLREVKESGLLYKIDSDLYQENDEYQDIDEEYEDEMEEYYDFDYYDDLAYYDEQDKEFRKEFEKNIMRDDVVDYYKSLTTEDIDYYFGPYFVRMIDYDQNNSHHCYDLWNHTLKTVEGIKQDGLTEEQFKKLRIAALFHDIGKPDVAKINEKTGQQVYYEHANRSTEIADFVLGSFGYAQEESEQIKQIEFYIAHHDDFISYKSNLPENMKNHEFVREINVDSIAEKIIENKYEFEKMGYNKDEIRAIVYTLVHGEEPEFKNFKGEKILIPINIEEVKEKINSGEYNSEYDASLEDYEMLLELCKADANAQAEKAERILTDGKMIVDGTKKDKLENMSNIEKMIPQAYEKVIELQKNISEKESNFEINEYGEIIRLNNTKTPLQQKEEELVALEKEAKTISEAEALIDRQNKGQNIGE